MNFLFDDTQFTGRVVKSWRNFLEEEKSCVDNDGLVYVQQLIDYIDRIYDDLHTNDHKRVARIFDQCDSIARKLLPHIKCDKLRQIHLDRINDCQMFIDKLQQRNDPNSDGLDHFLRDTYEELFSDSKSILSALGNYKPGTISDIYILERK